MTIWFLASLALVSTERYSDSFDLDAERHVALAMLADLEGRPADALAEYELAHLYSPTNTRITQELVIRLLKYEANRLRAREVLETALLYAPESPGLNRIFSLFELSYGEKSPRLTSSIWRLIETPTTRAFGRALLALAGADSAYATFNPVPSAGEDPCSLLALSVFEVSNSDPIGSLEKLHEPSRGCWK